MLKFNLLRYGALVGEIAPQGFLPHYRGTRLQQRRGLLPRYVAAQNLAVIWGTGSSQDPGRAIVQINPESGCAKRLAGAPILLACNRVRA